MSETLEQIIALGNEGAPEEWLAANSGQGIGGGFEGVDLDGARIAALLAEDDPDMPELPIAATPETQFYACNGANYTKGRGGNQPSYILVHYTAGKQTAAGAALANCKYFGRENVGASAHFFVDDGYTIWQSVPDGDTAWHAGNWSMNQRSVGIEVCTDGAFTEAEIERLAWLVQHLMAKYNIPASRVIRHYDVTGKHCPAHYVDDGRWADLHARITGGSAGGSASPAPADIDAVARDVIGGKYGNEPERSKRIRDLGYDYEAVRARVNAILGASTPSTPSQSAQGFGGKYRCTVNGLRVRTAPSLGGSVVASYGKGQTVTLDDWYTVADGWVWGRYTGSSSGKKRYIAVGKPTGGPDPGDYLVKI